MIIVVQQLHGIYLVCGKTDLRRGIDRLTDVVSKQYELNPYSKAHLCFAEHELIGLRHDKSS